MKRRFQDQGKGKRRMGVDDYAHHPTEISTTLDAAKDMNPKAAYLYFSAASLLANQVFA